MLVCNVYHRYIAGPVTSLVLRLGVLLLRRKGFPHVGSDVGSVCFDSSRMRRQKIRSRQATNSYEWHVNSRRCISRTADLLIFVLLEAIVLLLLVISWNYNLYSIRLIRLLDLFILYHDQTSKLAVFVKIPRLFPCGPSMKRMVSNSGPEVRAVSS